MANKSYIPSIVSLPAERHAELLQKYGRYSAIDATPFVRGVTDELLGDMPCGCKYGRFLQNRLVRARKSYLNDKKQGETLYAHLGQFVNQTDGPMTILRFESGAVVVAIPPNVAETNPVMEIRDGKVSISGRNHIDASAQKPGLSNDPLVRQVESALESRSRFRLIETMLGGTSININSLHSFEFMIVHPESKCSKWKAGEQGASPVLEGGAAEGVPRERRRRHHRHRTEHRTPRRSHSPDYMTDVNNVVRGMFGLNRREGGGGGSHRSSPVHKPSAKYESFEY